MPHRLIRVLVAAVVFAGVAAAWYTSNMMQAPANERTLQTSGTLEAKQVAIVVEVGGQIQELPVREGDTVPAGAVLARLDTASLDAQIARAEAAVEAAQASLAHVKAGARPEQVAQARASLEKSRALRDGAEQSWKDVRALRDNPQELDGQITQTRAQLQAAEATIIQVTNLRRAAQITRDRYQGSGSPQDRARFQAADAQFRAEEANLKAAQASRDGAQAVLNLLLALRADPIQLNAQVHAAQWRYEQAAAGADMAQAHLDALAAGPTRQEVAIAEAQVAQAQAALEQLQVQRDKMTLRSPIGGLVTALPLHSGENVQPGTKLLTLANLEAMYLALYVPETKIGRVRVGQGVQVTVDGLPGQSLAGQVHFIASRAEFTPANVQTKEERAKTVFMVKVRLSNPEGLLKPGMPADATIQLQ